MSRQGIECFEANRAFGALRRNIFESRTIVWKGSLDILWRLEMGLGGGGGIGRKTTKSMAG